MKVDDLGVEDGVDSVVVEGADEEVLGRGVLGASR